MTIESQLATKDRHINNRHQTELEIQRLLDLKCALKNKDDIETVTAEIERGRAIVEEQTRLIKKLSIKKIAREFGKSISTIALRHRKMQEERWVSERA